MNHPTRGLRQTIRRRASGQGGFSLIEVLVAMVLMIVVLGGIYTVWFGLQRTYSFTNDDMTAQAEARTALGEMVEFIRTAREPDSPTPEALRMVIVVAEPNTLVCWTDTDRDTEHDLELVRFRVNSDPNVRALYRDDSHTGDITFASGTPVRMVGNWVSNNADRPLFTYIGANGSVLDFPIDDPTQIRSIVIDLRIDVVIDKAPIAHELRSVVQPRNLRQY